MPPVVADLLLRIGDSATAWGRCGCILFLPDDYHRRSAVAARRGTVSRRVAGPPMCFFQGDQSISSARHVVARVLVVLVVLVATTDFVRGTARGRGRRRRGGRRWRCLAARHTAKTARNGIKPSRHKVILCGLTALRPSMCRRNLLGFHLRHDGVRTAVIGRFLLLSCLPFITARLALLFVLRAFLPAHCRGAQKGRERAKKRLSRSY